METTLSCEVVDMVRGKVAGHSLDSHGAAVIVWRTLGLQESKTASILPPCIYRSYFWIVCERLRTVIWEEAEANETHLLFSLLVPVVILILCARLDSCEYQA